MVNKIFLIAILLVCVYTTAIAQNKVVVVPLSSNNVAGTDGQLQYNDGGKNAGAEVYYDKGTGYVGIGTSNLGLELNIGDGDSPAVRLNQDGTSGWAPQIWYIEWIKTVNSRRS